MTYDFLKNKSILVTGGTGSFGQKFVRTLLAESAADRIVIFSRDEFKQTKMASSIPDPAGRLRFFLGDVRDQKRLVRAFHSIDFVVHAAALKHVPVLEYNPFEAVETNIIGTQNVIEAAINEGVKKVLCISTDKAANPASLYGATKLCAEKLTINGNAYSGGEGTRFAVVRYGNVFGSRGSIVETIAQQRPTGRIPLTHPAMTRFWITLEQGVELVLLSLEKMSGGEIFVPKIPSMKVSVLFKLLAPECTIEVVGMRPGEKLHEVLITPEESRHTKEFGQYYVILPEYNWWNGQGLYQDGGALAGGFQYASNTNTIWLSEADIVKFAADV